MAELHPYDVILRPVISEKATLKSETENQYTFEVASNANKIQIREAISLIFEKTALKVNTMVMPAKRGRRGRRTYIRARQWKKAVVTLAPGESIDLYNV